MQWHRGEYGDATIVLDLALVNCVQKVGKDSDLHLGVGDDLIVVVEMVYSINLFL